MKRPPCQPTALAMMTAGYWHLICIVQSITFKRHSN
jgi:hypothetical protein